MFGSLDFTTLVIIFVTLVISISLHEAMHAFSSYWLGDDTAEREGRITLNPLKHIDPVLTILMPMVTLVLFQVPFLAAKPVPFRPDQVRFGDFGAALVGLAGPFTNLLLALVGAGLLNAFGAAPGLDFVQIVTIFTIVNVALFIFNMMPIPPLDGSRLLYAFAPDPVRRVMEAMEQFGVFIVLALVLFIPGFTDMLSQLNSSLIDVLLTR
jgi:Zn-dependent protease